MSGHCLIVDPLPFIGSHKTKGLMVTQYNTSRLLVALGTLVVASCLICVFFVYRCLHAYPHRRGIHPPFRSSSIAFLSPSPSHTCLCRRILSIPTTSHILFSATYNHLGSSYIATANAWYPRFFWHIYRCADVPTNLFFMKKIILSLIARLAAEIASVWG